MRVRRVLGLSLTVVGFFGLFLDARAQSKITVGKNVQVSKSNENFQHNEVLGCADSQNPDRLMVGSIVD